MIGLIKKDLFLIKGNLKTLLVVFFVFVLMAFQGTMDLTFIFPMICIMLFISTFSYDEYNKWDAYAITLPNGKKNVVKSKYLATLILILISTIVMLILSIAIYYKKADFNLDTTISTMIGSLFAIILLESIMYPFIFKFGIEKGRIGLFVGVILVTTVIGLIMSKVDINSFNGIISIFNQYGLIILPIMMIIIFYLSYLISVRVYMKKEF